MAAVWVPALLANMGAPAGYVAWAREVADRERAWATLPGPGLPLWFAARLRWRTTAVRVAVAAGWVLGVDLATVTAARRYLAAAPPASVLVATTPVARVVAAYVAARLAREVGFDAWNVADEAATREAAAAAVALDAEACMVGLTREAAAAARGEVSAVGMMREVDGTGWANEE